MTGFAQFEIPGASLWQGETEQKQRPTESVASVASVARCREGVARMQQMRVPPAFGKAEWVLFIDDCRAFLAEWIDEAMTIGWTANELFGWPSSPYARRLDLRGLVTLLRGRRVAALNSRAAVISNRIGPPNVFRRDFDLSTARLAWDVFEREWGV